MNDYYAVSSKESIRLLNSSEYGLTKKEAQKRLEEFGYNELPKEKKFRLLNIFIGQFKNPLILLLILAGIISFFLGELVESIAIFAIVILNALLGFYQEYKAEKAIEALEKLSSPTARVLRSGEEQKIPAKEVVPGDILLLEAGDIVPADSRLLDISSLQIDEASLTGESVPSKKTIEPFKAGISISDQENMAFMGCTVTYGKGKSIVTNTGIKTEFGKIAASLQTTKETITPLQAKFERLAKQIGIAAVILIIIVLISGTLQGTLTFGKMLLFALVLAVATIPSALPVIVTVGLSKGAKDLAKKKMLIKKLPAAESLGASTIICSDKTGTITKNQMTITSLFCSNRTITVSGTGYNPEGNFFEGKKQINPKKLELFFRIGYMCNNAKLVRNGKKSEILGDPTEGSLIVLGKKGCLDDKQLQKKFTFIEELPFDSDRKRMSVIFKNNISKKAEAYVKGAPDLLLDRCDKIFENGVIRKLTKEDRKKILDVNRNYAKKALRVLALAYRELPHSKKYMISNVENNLVFVGLAGMIDPARDEVRLAVEQCQDAGIKVMIITGDQAITTKAVAEQIGLFRKGDLILSGEDVEKMSDFELEKIIDDVRIIARAMPIHKLRIVNVLQNKGHIVAMTGDGVNDAPALKKADIGIAMGITGTDVAKEVSKAILTDDNFASIVSAIKEGRNIYDKMIKSAKYLLSCNTGEIITILTAILLNFPLPLLPLQILLINMLTDTSPALGLGFEAAEEGIMKRQPRDPDEKPISNKLFASIIIIGLIMGLGTLFLFVLYKDVSLVKAQTVAFTALVMIQMFAVMSSRSLSPSLAKLNPFSNKLLFGAVCLSVMVHLAVIYWVPLQAIFGTVPLLWGDWLIILLVSLFGLLFMELSKLLMKSNMFGRRYVQ
ncbi:MAG: cation-translocating P-type ATPase [Candidatus Woesearchaeota archaeon]|nr:MAG: cation-translocating P-type ATPase [Candidatus Woesearchaeota archaeon]